MVTYTYFGHACFMLDDGNSKLLFDPFLTGNSKAAITADKVECDYILISHAHSDHLGDAPEIANRTGAEIVAIPEVLGLCTQKFKGLKCAPMNLGGTLKLPFGFIRMVPALHSSGVPGGVACGFVVNIGERNFYYAGDTALFEDMKIIGHRDKLTAAILPIGDNYTMGIEDAAVASQWLNAPYIIPVHYNTWDIIAQNVDEFKAHTEEITQSEVKIIKPGESWSVIY